MRGFRSAWLAGLLTLLVAGGSLQAWGQDATLEGYALSTMSSGVRFVFDSPSTTTIPASPTMEATVGHAVSTLESGPSGHALAASFWPGDAGANAPGFIRSSVVSGIKEGGCMPPSQTGLPPQSCSKPSDSDAQQIDRYFPPVPNYPVRAETFSPQGPHTSENGAIGQMSASSRDLESSATARLGSVGLDGLVVAESVSSTASTWVREGIAGSDGRTVVTNIQLFGGLITIGQLTSEAKAVSDGTKAVLSGTSRAANVKVEYAGHFLSAGIDHENITFATSDGGPNQAARAVQDANGECGGLTATVCTMLIQAARTRLAEQGISVRLLRAQDVGPEGPFASRGTGGLLVSINTSKYAPQVEELKTRLASLPPDVKGPLFASLEADKTFQFLIGGVNVSTVASPTFDLLGDLEGAADLSGGGFFGDDLGAVSDDLPSQVLGDQLDGGFDDQSATLIPGGSTSGRGPVALGSTPVAAVDTKGLPVALVILVLALGLLGARGMRVLAARLVDGA